MLIDNRIVKDRIWNIILFNSITLMIHNINIGVFLGERFINNKSGFLRFISIIVIHNIIVNGRLKIIILVADIILGIKFIRFIVNINTDNGINISTIIFEFLFDIVELYILFKIIFLIEFIIHLLFIFIIILNKIIIIIRFTGIIFVLESNIENMFIINYYI